MLLPSTALEPARDRYAWMNGPLRPGIAYAPSAGRADMGHRLASLLARLRRLEAVPTAPSPGADEPSIAELTFVARAVRPRNDAWTVGLPLAEPAFVARAVRQRDDALTVGLPLAEPALGGVLCPWTAPCQTRGPAQRAVPLGCMGGSARRAGPVSGATAPAG